MRGARLQGMCTWHSGCVVGIAGIVVFGWFVGDGLDCIPVITTTFDVTSNVITSSLAWVFPAASPGWLTKCDDG